MLYLLNERNRLLPYTHLDKTVGYLTRNDGRGLLYLSRQKHDRYARGKKRPSIKRAVFMTEWDILKF